MKPYKILWEQVIQEHFKVHGPCPRMIKDLFTRQPKFDTWDKIEEGRRKDHSEPGQT